jgi:hypothetical protein
MSTPKRYTCLKTVGPDLRGCGLVFGSWEDLKEHEKAHGSPDIDVRTHGPDGHWDYADIKRLCQYRDQLHETIRKLVEGESFQCSACKRAVPPDAEWFITPCVSQVRP